MIRIQIPHKHHYEFQGSITDSALGKVLIFRCRRCGAEQPVMPRVFNPPPVSVTTDGS